MAFQQGLSGLNAASQSLNVISNNVSNTSTVGFKLANTQFSDLYASALNGTMSNRQIGIGTQVAAVAQSFTQGDIASTDNPLDIAINGDGFFCMQKNGTNAYTRNGQFHINKDGYVVNSQGYNLTGYSVGTDGKIVQATPKALYVDTAAIAPKQTSTVTLGLNLDSSDTVPTTAWVNGTSTPATTSYNNSTSVTVYDSLGNSHVVTSYFRTQGGGNWDMFYQIDGGPTTTPGSPSLTFNSTGQLTTPMPITLSGLPVTTGATTPMSVTLDMTGSTQYGAAFARNAITQDGYSSGALSSIGISDDGTLEGSYSNGQTRQLGQVVLSKFANSQGLTVMGNNLWSESATSGQPVVGAPGSGTLGVLTGGAVENSNVDLTKELVNLITAQRNYQANAQSIKTEDAIMQTLVNLR
jgi:flagellar hook protein FlgE